MIVEIWLVIVICNQIGVHTASARGHNAPPDDAVVLSRRKRYVAFPDGASIAIALDMTHKVHTPDPLWTEGCSWAAGYQLPNSTYYQFFRKRNKHHLLQRRQRRDIYTRMEDVMDAMGYSGKDCIYRTLCETSRKYIPEGNSLVEELLAILFRFPQEKIESEEPEDDKFYHFASISGFLNNHRRCGDIYPGCPFSLLDLILGGYNADLNIQHESDLND